MRTAVVCSAAVAVLVPWSGAISGTSQVSTNSPEIVVSANRVETPAAEVASSVTVVGAAEIARKNPENVAAALETVPGLTVTHYGGPGSQASIFLRGANSEEALVLVDGVEVNDPTSAGRGASLDYLGVADIDRIEVLRGPQSCLYGSDAMAGVINIVTKTGAGKPTATLQAEAGAYNTFKESAALRGGNEKVNYAVSAQRTDSDGISAARKQDGNTEKDGYESTTVGGRLGITPSDQFDLDIAARYLKAKFDFDAAGGPGGDSIGDVGEEQRIYVRPQAHLSLADGNWQQYLGVSLADHDRKSRSAWGTSTFAGQLTKADWRHDVRLGAKNLVTAGAEFEHETAKTDTLPKADTDTFSAYLQDQYKACEAFSVVAGGRYDHHDTFGSEWTYRVAPLCVLPETGTRLKATYGTAFKAPSLYQLYAPATPYGPIGNPDLNPEKSHGLDAGVEQPFGDRLVAGVTWFQNWFEDMIDFDNGYVNRSRANTRGVECTASCRPVDALRVQGAYTYTHTEDKSTGQELIRRPKNRATLDTFYRWTEKVETGVGLLYAGRRSDRYYSATMFTPTDVTLDDYLLVNLYGSYRLRENIEVYGRIENLFNTDYQEVAGYGTPGISAYAGVKVTL